MKNKNSKWTPDEFRIKLTQKSNQILKYMNHKIRGARNPFILAAAIVYCADKMLARELGTKSILTQKSASEAMQVAEYSIRDHYVKILKPLFSL
jgi:transcription initiation factor TFIIIB Brf1 subunit/transcription initiation factor TFIIB